MPVLCLFGLAVMPATALAVAPVNTSVPVVSGTVKVGQTLTTTNGTWTGSPASYSYQWQRCDVVPSLLGGSTGNSPQDLAFSSAGDLFTVAYGPNAFTTPGQLTKFPLGGAGSSFGTTGRGPQALAVSSDRIYVANFFSDNVTVIDRDTGTTVTTISVLPRFSPRALALDPTRNALYVATGSGWVSKIDTSNNAVITDWANVGGSPIAATLDSAGNLYVARGSSDNIAKVSPTASPNATGVVQGSPWPVSSGGSNPYDLTIDPAGNLYVANVDSSLVNKIQSSDGSPAGAPWPVSTGSGTSPAGITIDDAGYIYTANQSSDTVTRISPAGTAISYGATGSTPRAIVVDADRNVYTVNLSSNNVSKLSLTCSDIPGATSSTYTLVGADNGKTIRSKVTASDGGSGNTVAISGTTDASVTWPPQNTVAPTITGKSEIGETLTAGIGTWGGDPTPSYAYQWQRCDSNGANCVDIPGATTTTLTLTSSDLGKKFRVKVTGTNTQGTSDAFSSEVGPVTEPPSPGPNPGPNPGPDPGPTPAGKPKLKVKVLSPKRVLAGKRLTLKVKVRNLASPTSTRAAAPKTARKLRICLRRPKGFTVIKRKGGKGQSQSKRKSNKICWRQGKLAAGRTSTKWARVQTSTRRAARFKIRGFVSARNSGGAKSKAAGKSKLRVRKARKPGQ